MAGSSKKVVNGDPSYEETLSQWYNDVDSELSDNDDHRDSDFEPESEHDTESEMDEVENSDELEKGDVELDIQEGRGR